MLSEIPPVANRHPVLILQHPQEPDHELGSAKLATAHLQNCTLKIGLSWRNLSAALGREAQPSRWAVLYLGSGAKGEGKPRPGLNFVTKSANLITGPDEQKIRGELEGIVVLDGTWSQAKALWWRNAWLLKLKRAILVPSRKSLYGVLRKEPRRECLSTIESIAEALVDLGEGEALGEKLRARFQAMLDEHRSQLAEKKKPRPSG